MRPVVASAARLGGALVFVALMYQKAVGAAPISVVFCLVDSTSTAAEIEEVRQDPSRLGSPPQYRYRYEFDGRTYEGVGPRDNRDGVTRVGDEVPVLVNRWWPDVSCLGGDQPRGALDMIGFVTAGLVLVAVGNPLWSRYRGRATSTSAHAGRP
jgi:hypothetical protein